MCKHVPLAVTLIPARKHRDHKVFLWNIISQKALLTAAVLKLVNLAYTFIYTNVLYIIGDTVSGQTYSKVYSPHPMLCRLSLVSEYLSMDAEQWSSARAGVGHSYLWCRPDTSALRRKTRPLVTPVPTNKVIVRLYGRTLIYRHLLWLLWFAVSAKFDYLDIRFQPW